MERKDFEAALERHQQIIDRIKESAHALHASVNQTYGDGLPYSYHLDMVACCVTDFGHLVCACADDVVPLLFGAYYHDSIEDARLSYNDVKKVASKLMTDVQAMMATEIVYALTNDKGRNRAERAGERYYAGIRQTPYAPFVKLCDRLANVTFSCSGENSDSNRMKEVYKGEMGHFLADITAPSSDQRMAVPREVVLKIAECVIDDMEREENKWWEESTEDFRGYEGSENFRGYEGTEVRGYEDSSADESNLVPPYPRTSVPPTKIVPPTNLLPSTNPVPPRNIAFPIAKVNLGLNVVRRRDDGYHDLETVFYPVPLHDALEVQLMNEAFPSAVDCDLKVTNLHIEGDEQRNLVVRAYNLLKQDFPWMPRVHAHLNKVIPTQAGMGGGSSDCAYMIRLLNDLFSLGLSTQQMIDYAARLGADCPFFIMSRPAYAEGIGERLEPVSLSLSGWYMAVVRPDIPVSTKEAFSLIRPQKPVRNCRDIVMQPVETWRDQLTNDFEQSVFALHPEIGAIKQQLYALGAVYAAMSGSGSALFALFRTPVSLDPHFKDCQKYVFQLP
jgi:4-diphosphocytidyl-2-C-methyl-D-erythritol kinase